MSQQRSGRLETSKWTAAGTAAGSPVNRAGEVSQPAGLIGLIEGEIVPRLLMAAAASAACGWSPESAPGPEDVAELSRLLLADDGVLSVAFVEVFLQRGLARERICRELLAPAARYLQRLWTQSECEFSGLTRALGRLRKIVRELLSVQAD
jgi:hypothetical protein